VPTTDRVPTSPRRKRREDVGVDPRHVAICDVPQGEEHAYRELIAGQGLGDRGAVVRWSGRMVCALVCVVLLSALCAAVPIGTRFGPLPAAAVGTGSIGDVVWDDRNGDGAQSPDEPGRGGVRVALVGAGADGTFDTSDDVSFDPVLTGSGGSYGFANLDVGTYRVLVTLPPGASITGGSNPQTVTLAEGEVNTTVDFGLRLLDASIGDVVYDDVNGSGGLDAGDGGIEGATVELRQGAATIASVVTPASGVYSFTGVAAGTYSVEVTPPVGYVLTTVANPQSVTIAAGERRGTVDFGFRRVGSIGDVVFWDQNSNGTQDSGEPGVPNALLSLAGPAAATTRTDLAGHYTFSGLAAGIYTVTLTVPPSASVTTANNPASVTVAVGEAVTTTDFGLAGMTFNPGAVVTVAGNGANATLDGTGSGASFRWMGGISAEGDSVYVFTRGSVRRVNKTTSEVTTVAGSATLYGCTDSTTPTAVRFSAASNQQVGDIVSDGTYLYAADPGCGKIRKITIATGATSTLATLSSTVHLTLAPDGYLYAVSNSTNPARVYRLDRTSGASTLFATLPVQAAFSSNRGSAIASDATDLWVMERSSGTPTATNFILRIALSDASVSTFASGVAVGGSVCNSCWDYSALVVADGYLYGASGERDNVVRRWSITDGSYVGVVGADQGNGASGGGFMDGAGPDAWFRPYIRGLVFDGTYLWVNDASNYRVRKIVPAAPHTAELPASATTTVSPNPAVVWTFAGNGTDATVDGFGDGASFRTMGGVEVVGDYVYVMTTNSTRKVNKRTGEVATLNGIAGNPTGCVDGDNPGAVRFSSTEELATDGKYLYTAGCGAIRRISLETGAVSRVTDLVSSEEIAYGPDGYLYATQNASNKIWRIDPTTGTKTVWIETPAGTDVGALAADATYLWFMREDPFSLWRADFATATASSFVYPLPDSFDVLESAGDFLYTAQLGSSIRRISKTTGIYEQIAGTSTRGWEDGVGAEAKFEIGVKSLASDGRVLWVADSGNKRLRVIEDPELFGSPGTTFGDDAYAPFVDDVNLAIGNLTLSETDVEIPTAGPALGITRSYNSGDRDLGAFGRGWSFPYTMTWRADAAGAIAVTYGDGRRALFTPDGAGGFHPPDGYWAHLQFNGAGGYTLTEKDGTVASFNATGKLTSLANSSGHAIDLAYNASGKLTTATSSVSGRTLTFTWDRQRITTVSTPSVAAHGGVLTWSYTYSGGLLTKVCDPRPHPGAPPFCTTYTYSAGSLVTAVKPRGNTIVEAHYDAQGRVDWRKDGLGGLTRIMYLPNRQVRVFDPRNNPTLYEYDDKYREIRMTDAAGGVTAFRYDAAGNRDQVTDPNNNVTTMTFDGHRNVTSVTDGDNKITNFAYDLLDNLIASRDPRSISPTDDTFKTSFGYDSARRRTTATTPATADFPAGVTTTSTYTTGAEAAIGGGTMPAGLLRTDVDGRGATTTYSYDSKGDLRRLVDRVGLQTDFLYDELGRPLSMTVTSDSYPAGVTTTVTYNELSKPLIVAQPAVTNVVSGVTHQQQTAFVYDANANLVSTTESDLVGGDAPRSSTIAYDNNDRPVQQVDSHGGAVTRAFDAAGNQVLETDAAGRIAESAYNERDFLTSVTERNHIDDPITATAPRDVVLQTFGYDAGGRRVSAIDALGRETRFTYDGLNRPRTTTLIGYHNRDGSTRDIVLEDLSYDAAGNVVTHASGNGDRVVANTVDAAGRVTSSVLDPGVAPKLNRATTYTYDANRNPLAVTVTDITASTYQARYVYDAADRVTTATTENGAEDLVTTYSYDQRGLVLSSVDPRGNATGGVASDYRSDFEYDEVGRRTRSTAPPAPAEEAGGAATTERANVDLGYNTYGDMTHVKDARGAVTATAYDALGQPIEISYPTYGPPAGGTLNPVEQRSYDAVGNVIRRTDRRGGTTNIHYDTLNRAIRQIDPLVSGAAARGQSSFEYDDAGNPTAVVNPVGARTEATFDDLNRQRGLVEIVRQPTTQSFTTTFDYDDLGNRTYERDPADAVITYSYNPASELVATTDALSKTTTVSRDVAGRVTTVTDPLGRVTANSYDPAGRQVSTQWRSSTGQPLATEYYTPDPIGNRTEYRSARSTSPTDATYLTSYDFDARNQLRELTEPVDATTPITTTFGYDIAGNLSRLTDGRNNTTIYTYNPWNLPESTIEPSTPGQTSASDRTYTISYDTGGLPTTETQPGVTIARSFDALGRLTNEAGTGTGVTAATRTFGWDLAGRITSAGHPAGPISFSYDDRNLMLSNTEPGNATTAASFSYDARGLMTSRADAAGTTTFTYTDRRELDTVTDALTGLTTNHDRDDAGQLTAVGYNTTPATSRVLTYDDRGRLDDDTLSDGTTTLYQADHDYDADNHLTRQTITAAGNSAAGQHDYTYDRAGRLTTWTGPAGTVSYDYDNAGNRTDAGSTTYTYDERNRLTAAGSTTYTWTPRGTLASISGTTTVDHDALGRQIQYDAATYTYDSLDRLATAGATTLSFAGLEINPDAAGTALYARTPASELVALDDATAARIVGENRHGDLAWLLDNNAALTDTRIWDPYGNTTGTTGTLSPGVGFQADITDTGSGSVWMGARWYDPDTGTFGRRDTYAGIATNPISLNRHLYANASPLDYYDPDGLKPKCPRFAKKVCDFVDDEILEPLEELAEAGVDKIVGGAKTVNRKYIQPAYNGTKRAYHHVTTSASRSYQLAWQGLRTTAAAARAAGQQTWSAVERCAGSSTCRGIAISIAAIALCGTCGIATSTLIQGGAGFLTGTLDCGGNYRCVAASTVAGMASGAVGGYFNNASQATFLRSFFAQGATGELARESVEGHIDIQRVLLAGGLEAAAGGVLTTGARHFKIGHLGQRGPTTSRTVAPRSAGARFVAGSDGVVTDLVPNPPNAISIGRFPAYVNDAASSGARAFNVGDDWAAMVARKDRFGGIGEGSEIWIRNTRFLDQAVARGSQIRLASDPFDLLNEGSFFLREVEYLRGLGAL
jgi:RHS repeat-associated protein